MNPLKMVTIKNVMSPTEIIEYAKYLGIDMNMDQDLLWIAVEGV